MNRSKLTLTIKNVVSIVFNSMHRENAVPDSLVIDAKIKQRKLKKVKNEDFFGKRS